MSLLYLADVGIYRDHAAPQKPINATATVPVPAQPGADPASTPTAVDASPVTSYGKLLAGQIPAEALLAYTTVLALVPDGNPHYETGRWIIYAASIVVCAATIAGAYLARRTNSNFQDNNAIPHLPYLPITTAVVAMAVYGLTVPGSPLQQSMNASSFAVVAGSLAVAGGVVMSLFVPSLGKGNSAVIIPDPDFRLSAGDHQGAAGTHTLVATLAQSGAPVSDEPVSFRVEAGPNAGAAGTTVPVSGRTDENGSASFTYTDANGVGTDVIAASVTVSGTPLVARASKVWL